MKKIIFIALVTLIATYADAEPKYRGTSEALYPPGTSVVQVFDNYSTVGTGTLNP